MLATIAAPSLADDRAPLVDQTGRHFSFESLRGTPLVITFVSAHCDSACPIVDAQFARAAQTIQYGPLALRFLTLSLDPQRDTPADMRALAARFEARSPRWLVVTGNAAAINGLMKRFGVARSRDARGFATSHTTLVYLFDARLRLEQTLVPSDDLASTILRSVRQ